ncbi:hypothetical protein Daesc_004493 [Daldinia eschscholtzii]|uniref:Velvet domain-containing protein n=1 Tax=Daldinia eschscholtzii TaxID=292717 RepID=A0AAX6MPW7_9PEZI
MSGPSAHHPGYAQLPPPMSFNYQQDPITNPHRANMPPPRTNMAPPNMPGPRDRAGELGATENGVNSSGPNPLSSKPGPEEKDKPAPQPIEGGRPLPSPFVCAQLDANIDQDRRPITPPPCIRLVVMDKTTGKEVDCKCVKRGPVTLWIITNLWASEVEHQHYVLHVDLWSENGDKEVNLVKHSQQSPSISSTQASSFREVIEGSQAGGYGYQSIVPSNREYAQQPSPGYPHAMPPYQPDPYGQGYSYPPQAQAYGYPGSGYRNDMVPGVPQLPSQPMFGARFPQDMGHPITHNRIMGPQSPNGMYTRNLIGSLAASASRLTDPTDKIGIWFILQDLSVRTEGWFRLRFSFINLRRPDAVPNGGSDAELLNRGRAPVLAQVFSEKFQVYSAKKFPGVCESTALSKCFAVQGVKIPIRKDGQDGKGSKGRGSDDEDDN